MHAWTSTACRIPSSSDGALTTSVERTALLSGEGPFLFGRSNGLLPCCAAVVSTSFSLDVPPKPAGGNPGTARLPSRDEGSTTVVGGLVALSAHGQGQHEASYCLGSLVASGLVCSPVRASARFAGCGLRGVGLGLCVVPRGFGEPFATRIDGTVGERACDRRGRNTLEKAE
jgi:hypothetical protein